MRIRNLLIMLAALVLAGTTAAAAESKAREQGRLLIASEVLEELRTTRDQAIPDRLLQHAYGILVIPDLTKVAFFAGGRRGKGVMVVRDARGRFSNPVFVTMTGGSFGWQWGVQSADIVLVFTTPKGVEGINGGKVTLGADASVAAGPVGRQAEAATDATFKAEVYSYSRSRGVFAGLALDGTVISIDDESNADFYGKPGVAAGDIIAGSVTSDDDTARRFLAAVATSTGTSSSPQRSASAAPPPAAPAPPAPEGSAPPAAAAPQPAAAQSFPMSDPQPGQEPK
jgi:lipid-binding SYLF domain-containing protein